MSSYKRDQVVGIVVEEMFKELTLERFFPNLKVHSWMSNEDKYSSHDGTATINNLGDSKGNTKYIIFDIKASNFPYDKFTPDGYRTNILLKNKQLKELRSNFRECFLIVYYVQHNKTIMVELSKCDFIDSSDRVEDTIRVCIPSRAIVEVKEPTLLQDELEDLELRVNTFDYEQLN